MRIFRLTFALGLAPLVWLACTGDVAPASPDASTGTDAGNDGTLKDSGGQDAVVVADSGGDAALDAGSDAVVGSKFGCDPQTCDLGSQACCYGGLNQGVCSPIGDGGAFCNKGNASQFNCGKSSDCANGTVCCATRSSIQQIDASVGFFGRCASTCAGSNFFTAYILCGGPNDVTTCATAAADGGAKTCSPVTSTTQFPPSYYYCK